MNRINITLNEDEAKCLLLMIQSASEVYWVHNDTRSALQVTAERLTSTIMSRMPHLDTFLIDQGLPMGEFM